MSNRELNYLRMNIGFRKGTFHSGNFRQFLTCNLKGAWHTVNAMLLSNCEMTSQICYYSNYGIANRDSQLLAELHPDDATLQLILIWISFLPEIHGVRMTVHREQSLHVLACDFCHSCFYQEIILNDAKEVYMKISNVIRSRPLPKLKCTSALQHSSIEFQINMKTRYEIV